MSATDSRAMEFFNTLKNLLQQYYTKPLSARLLARGQHDHRMITSIRRIRKKQNLVIQRTDKSKVFHVGTAKSYHEKSIEYKLWLKPMLTNRLQAISIHVCNIVVK